MHFTDGSEIEVDALIFACVFILYVFSECTKTSATLYLAPAGNLLARNCMTYLVTKLWTRRKKRGELTNMGSSGLGSSRQGILGYVAIILAIADPHSCLFVTQLWITAADFANVRWYSKQMVYSNIDQVQSLC